MKTKENKSQRGASLFEYAILLSLLVLFLLASIRAMTSSFSATFSKVNSAADG